MQIPSIKKNALTAFPFFFLIPQSKQFNVLWLNPHNPATFPEGFIDALEDPLVLNTIRKFRTEDTIEGRLRAKMQADSLRPLNMSLDHQDEPEQEQSKSTLRQTPYSEEDIEEATQFLRLTVRSYYLPLILVIRVPKLICVCVFFFFFLFFFRSRQRID